MQYKERTISKKSVYQGNIIDVDLVSVILPNGKEATRDVVLHPGASAIVPVNDKGEVYMVTQYRTPIEKTLLEIPAGKLDPGEDPMICAQRELKEETGLTAENIKHVVSIHSTPGFSDEVLHLFIAKGLQEGDSCADEDEFISCRKIHISELVNMILKNEITDAKSIIGILMADKMIKGEIEI